ncbi:MAG: hypothetical protein COV55_02325 [Candidatus Komeilibacteria bacterium CG11_big_fil_rev_8_21_14_0_20_36_20]|uniref:UPF0102 protein COV55_02325 n=1 Tax=Candidatus Komeilibacteria bacterium CG11_big_fil_rev_8_21_14_0_20_36_20 TaxID=1974477 RepID=A0A2H0ND46_9BACT|nr:MAG: hypothetical protein COV55_02325 [Candidatus Komeilibacteria bacterium CG11_big_fil_rev_8_21_14_0_20_36_20]PIR81810.1 MAG: hypothetical protein COU21_01385 [Candidatus Komeilibacteria bacterium CG10_big_fil_rev_8_21_14_0_10_36_65]PJC55300.1 MAG: hypothetical protein CO027_02720 [Candidatus Komeilibacteria bacterium CG_4_9_14_0_2_um_filter_36_13]
MSKKNYRQQLGSLGEKIAAQFYQQRGWKIVQQNYWTRYGELDLVLQKNNRILIVEVKTRNNYNLGYGEETVNQQKLEHLNQAYQIMQKKNKLPENCEIEICVIETKNRRASIKRFLV